MDIRFAIEFDKVEQKYKYYINHYLDLVANCFRRVIAMTSQILNSGRLGFTKSYSYLFYLAGAVP